MAIEPDELTSRIMVGLIVAAYSLPLIVAWLRGHHNKVSISLLNLLLGWTGIGWLVALVWSASAISKHAKPSAADESSLGGGEHDSYQKLEKLAALKERGHLTAEEFEAEKSKILNS